MDVYLLDKNFEIVAIVDDFTSLIWRRKYYECGDFELHVSHELFETIAFKSKYIYRPDRREVGIIENYGLNAPTAFCKGRFLESILSDRIIFPTFKANGMTHEMITVLLAATYHPEISQGNLSGTGYDITTQVTGDNLMEYLYELLGTIDATYSVHLNIVDKTLAISTWQGIDRSESAVFSQDWDNLTGFSYEYNNKELRNCAIVAGEGEGNDRIYIEIDRSNGEPRREIYIDARDIQQEENEPQENYKARLIQRGIEKLSEYGVVENCETVIDTESNLKYMENFDLGDICTVTDILHGISCAKRLTECEEVYENGTFSLSAIFGSGYLSITKYMERKLK